jgi:exonuclease VII small subunit
MKYLKPIIVLILVFIAGICVGAVGTRFAIKRYIQQAVRKPELVRLRIERDLTRELSLDAAQQTKLEEILIDFQRGVAKARAEHQPRVRPLLAEARQRINDILTPEQQKKFEQLQAEYGVFSFGTANPTFPRLQRLRELREQNKNSSP